MGFRTIPIYHTTDIQKTIYFIIKAHNILGNFQ